MESFAFPASVEHAEPLTPGDNYEGPVPRQSPGLAPVVAAKPSTYRLHRLADNLQMVELSVFDIANFAYDPPRGHVPQGDLQWYVQHPGDSRFALYGSPFRYRLEKNSFWER